MSTLPLPDIRTRVFEAVAGEDGWQSFTIGQGHTIGATKPTGSASRYEERSDHEHVREWLHMRFQALEILAAPANCGL